MWAAISQRARHESLLQAARVNGPLLGSKMDAAAAAAAAPFGRTYGGMLKHLATLLWSYPRWRLLLGFYGAVFTVATVRGATRKKAPKRAKKAAKKQSAAPKSLGKGFKAQFTTLIKIAIPGWTSTAALRLYAYTLMNLLRAYLNIQLVLVGSTGIQRIAEMDWHKMFYQQSIYMSLCAPLALLNAIMRYVQNRIALDMRTNLLEFVHANYLDRDATFYRMSAVGKELLSTLDQRCTADIEEFAMDTALLYGNIVKPAIGVNKNTAAPLLFEFLPFLVYFSGLSRACLGKPSFSIPKFHTHSTGVRCGVVVYYAEIVAYCDQIIRFIGFRQLAIFLGYFLRGIYIIYTQTIQYCIHIIPFNLPLDLGLFMTHHLYLPRIAIRYFLLSAKWLQVVMPSFGRLTAQQQDLEGVLRSTHSGAISLSLN